MSNPMLRQLTPAQTFDYLVAFAEPMLDQNLRDFREALEHELRGSPDAAPTGRLPAKFVSERDRFVPRLRGALADEVGHAALPPGIDGKLKVRALCVPAPEFTMNPWRLAAVGAGAALLGVVVGGILDKLLSWGAGGTAIQFVTPGIFAALFLYFGTAPMTAGLRNSLIAAGVVGVGLGAARWIIGRSFLGRLWGFLRAPAAGGGLGFGLIAGVVALLIYAARIWIRMGQSGAGGGSAEWLEATCRQYREQLDADLQAMALAQSMPAPRPRERVQGNDGLLVEIFNLRRSASGESRELIEELAQISGLLLHEDGQAAVEYGPEIQARELQGEIEVLGEPPAPGAALMWVKQPVLAVDPDGKRRVVRRGQLKRRIRV